jgi:hypothetical protein
MNTTETRRRDQFADELMPRNIWFLATAPHTTTEAQSFDSQDAMLEWIDEARLTPDEILYALSSTLNIRTGVRVMCTFNATDIVGWLDEYRDERETERAHLYRDRSGAGA